MPLSEHEQRLLEQMERAFYEEDPQFASSMQQPRVPLGRRVVLSVVLAVVGLAVILAALASRMPVLGVVGFALLLVAGSRLLPARGAGASAVADPSSQPQAARQRRTMSQRFEDRWNRRRGE